jgi:hypothetical protein
MSALKHITSRTDQSSSHKEGKFVSYDTQLNGEQNLADPTEEYNSYEAAYAHFSDYLFDGQLPPCLITLQRKRHTLGYYSRQRFASRQNGEITTDEIALNPDTFDGRTDKEILSMLVHEQVHLWQAHFGKPSRGRYHNQEWARRMLAIGLRPESLDKPGKMTGQAVTHKILPGGRFDRVADELLATGFRLHWQSPLQWSIGTLGGIAPVQTSDSKVKYTCPQPQCSANAWAKPNSRLECAQCFQKYIERCEHWMYSDEILALVTRFVMRPCVLTVQSAV